MGALRALMGLGIIYGAYNGNLTLVIIGFAGLLVNYFNDDTRNKNEINDDENNQDRISCPFCAEKIMREAKVCRFCSNEIPITVENKSSHSDASIAVENKSSLSDAPTIEKINDDEYEIVFDGKKYNYAGYKYDNLQHATNYAELVKKRKNTE